ncbi:MAG: hypothetical protein KJO19_00515 [Woeseia sp.]|nr:hypothetical protein [Woeseia sp.]
MLVISLILFATTLAGIFFACHVFDYDITIARKIAAALVFTILNVVPLPIPVPFLAVAGVGLYISLVDSAHKHVKVIRVFSVTFLLSILVNLIFQLITQPA